MKATSKKKIVITPQWTLQEVNVPYFYRPPTKLREGDVFTCVCLSTAGGGVGISGPMSFLGGGGGMSEGSG